MNLSKRHSVMFNNLGERAPIFANYLNTTMSKSLKSLNTIDMMPSGRGRGRGGACSSTISMSMMNNNNNNTNDDPDTQHQQNSSSTASTATNSSSRPLHKYQKSVTCDLSTYIANGLYLTIRLIIF